MKEEISKTAIYEKLREKIFFYVTYQRRTEAEIRRNFLPLFKKYNISRETYNDVVEELKEKGYIDDVEYVRRKFKTYMSFRRVSVKEIEHKILQKGIAKDLIDEYMQNNKEELYQYEIEAAQLQYEKKIKDRTDEEVKQYLRKRGYMEDIIKQL